MSALCLSCEIVYGRKAVAGGAIRETEHFHAHQDVSYPVPGLVIVASKRHFRVLTEMNAAETAEFLPLVQEVRRAQEKIGIEHVYYFYNEDTRHHSIFGWCRVIHGWRSSANPSKPCARRSCTPATG